MGKGQHCLRVTFVLALRKTTPVDISMYAHIFHYSLTPMPQAASSQTYVMPASASGLDTVVFIIFRYISTL